jgi:hypothetical protein
VVFGDQFVSMNWRTPETVQDPYRGTGFAFCELRKYPMTPAFPFPPMPPQRQLSSSIWAIIAVIVLVLIVIALIAMYSPAY